MITRHFSKQPQKKEAADCSRRLCLAWLVVLSGMAVSLTFSGCANFKILGRNLDFMNESYIVGVKLSNANQFKDVRGGVVEWNQKTGEVLSGDYAQNKVGMFAFFVRSSSNQYIMAYSDTSGNDRYDKGEPAWIHSDADGRPVPVVFDVATRKPVKPLRGKLSKSVVIPERMFEDVKRFAAGRTREEIISRLNIPVALGDIANLSEARFSSAHGEEGLWKPSDFPISSGIGIYFLEEYDPNRIPVLFVYGAGGSPQD